MTTMTVPTLAELQSDESWIIVGYEETHGVCLWCERPSCGWTRAIGHNPTVEEAVRVAHEHGRAH